MPPSLVGCRCMGLRRTREQDRWPFGSKRVYVPRNVIVLLIIGKTELGKLAIMCRIIHLEEMTAKDTESGQCARLIDKAKRRLSWLAIFCFDDINWFRFAATGTILATCQSKCCGHVRRACQQGCALWAPASTTSPSLLSAQGRSLVFLPLRLPEYARCLLSHPPSRPTAY